jgi:hypothetical protein
LAPKYSFLYSFLSYHFKYEYTFHVYPFLIAKPKRAQEGLGEINRVTMFTAPFPEKRNELEKKKTEGIPPSSLLGVERARQETADVSFGHFLGSVHQKILPCFPLFFPLLTWFHQSLLVIKKKCSYSPKLLAHVKQGKIRSGHSNGNV